MKTKERNHGGKTEKTDRGRFSVSVRPDAGRTQNRPLSLLLELKGLARVRIRRCE